MESATALGCHVCSPEIISGALVGVGGYYAVKNDGR